MEGTARPKPAPVPQRALRRERGQDGWLRRVVDGRPWRKFAFCVPCTDDAAFTPGWRVMRAVP